MTQQHLIGEVSELLGLLWAATPHPASARAVDRLRLEAEVTSPAGLGPIVVRALALTDRLCWDSLSRGDTASFVRQAELSAELQAFGVCAGLLDDV